MIRLVALYGTIAGLIVAVPTVWLSMTDAQSFERMYRNPLYRMPITFIEMFPVGVLISAISAGILRNSRVFPARALS